MEPPSSLNPIIEVWKSAQTKLPEIVRWKKYLDKEEGARKQNSLQHSHSIALLGALVLQKIKSQIEVDSELVLTALTIHDIGEAEIGKDTTYVDKKTSIDLQEYLAFKKVYENLTPPTFNYLNKAFLLQFARKNPEMFPEGARTVMKELAETRLVEAKIFDAIERLDYVLYAMEQYKERENKKILVQVLRNQVPHLDRLSKEIGGFDLVWSSDVSVWCKLFIDRHMGLWEEKHGEI